MQTNSFCLNYQNIHKPTITYQPVLVAPFLLDDVLFLAFDLPQNGLYFILTPKLIIINFLSKIK